MLTFALTLLALSLGVFAGRAVATLLAAMDARALLAHREDAAIDLGVPAGVDVSRWPAPLDRADDPTFDPDPSTPIYNDMCYSDARFVAKQTDFDAELKRLRKELGL